MQNWVLYSGGADSQANTDQSPEQWSPEEEPSILRCVPRRSLGDRGQVEGEEKRLSEETVTLQGRYLWVLHLGTPLGSLGCKGNPRLSLSAVLYGMIMSYGRGELAPPFKCNKYLEYFKAVDIQHPDTVLLIGLLHGLVNGLQGKKRREEVSEQASKREKWERSRESFITRTSSSPTLYSASFWPRSSHAWADPGPGGRERDPGESQTLSLTHITPKTKASHSGCFGPRDIIPSGEREI